jgi:hypothetical protein
MDRTDADPSIRWRGWLTFQIDPGPLGDFASRFLEAVRRDPRRVVLSGVADPRDSAVEAEVELSARTYDEAVALTDAILTAAMESAGSAGSGAASVYTGVGNLAPVDP